MEQGLKKALKKASNINSLLLLLFYTIVIIASYVAPPLLRLALPETSPYFSSVYSLCIYLFQYVITVPVLLLVFRHFLGKKIGWTLRDSYHKPQATGSQLVRWCVIALGLTYAASLFSNILFNVIQSMTGQDWYAVSVVADENWVGYLCNLIAFPILAPIFEEMLFRATIFRNTERFGSWFAVIMSGIFFGLWHGNYEQIIYAAVMGMCVAFLTTKTRSVLPGMLVHFIMNLIGASQSIAYSGLDLNKLESGEIDFRYVLTHFGQFAVIGLMNVVVYGLVIAGIVLFIMELVKHRETFRLGGNPVAASGWRKAVVYLTAPVTLLTVILLLGFTIISAMQ